MLAVANLLPSLFNFRKAIPLSCAFNDNFFLKSELSSLLDTLKVIELLFNSLKSLIAIFPLAKSGQLNIYLSIAEEIVPTPEGLSIVNMVSTVFIVFMLIIFMVSWQIANKYFNFMKQFKTKELNLNSYISFLFLSSQINNLLGAYLGESPPPTKQKMLLLFKIWTKPIPPFNLRQNLRLCGYVL